MSKTTVIYHSADFDGIFCREIARKFLPDANLIGWDFGDNPLVIPDGTLYVFDLPLDKTFGLAAGMTTEGAGSLKSFCKKQPIIWIDHHKSSIDSHPTDIPGYRIDGVAACRLAWQWFATLAKNTGCPEAPMASDTAAVILPDKAAYFERRVTEPYAVRLAGEYDIWDKRDPDAELFQHGLRSQELTDRTWANLLCVEIDESLRGTGMEITPSEQWAMMLLNQGRCLQYAKTHENESIIKSAGSDVDFEGLHFLCCNHARYNSFLFTAALKPEHDACLGFAWRKGEWTVSLYHAPGKEHHDLSLIAVKHGGGGHKGACGFTCKTLPFNLA